MTDTYSSFAEVCTKFYDLVVNPVFVADFIDKKIAKYGVKSALYVGGFFLVAKELAEKGYDLTVVDYTDEMVRGGKKRLLGIKVLKRDIRSMDFNNRFDAVLCVGRVFTHMLSNSAVSSALASFKKSIRSEGIVFIDNYEDSRIEKTDYFNKEVKVSDASVEISRTSSTEKVSSSPFIVKWKAKYNYIQNGVSNSFADEMNHRAFSRKEFKSNNSTGFNQWYSGNYCLSKTTCFI